MTVWMVVTKDKYELPVAIVDTSTELAKMCGVSNRTVISGALRDKSGAVKKSRYRKVVIKDGEEE